MIAKTVTGSDFTGALEYGAGLRSDRTNKQSELLSVANLGSNSVHGMAAEMRAVADMSDRIKQPVWHTVLSWAPEEIVDREQKLKAAALYCELMGASLDRHQVAVFEHKDKQHPHIHIYINRVPTDGGPALRTDQNYARNVKATRQIREQLGMAPLPSRRQSTKDLDPQKEVTCGYVRDVLSAALADQAIRSVDQLVEHLRAKQIEAYLKRDGKGVLVGSSFRYEGSNVKGTEIGIKAKQLREHFSQYGREALRSNTPFAPATASASGGLVGDETSTSAGPFVRLEDTTASHGGPTMDDAERNENSVRRKRRRPKL
ncbi:relaxase/mobilization nuclease domain-containing protein [Hymenobacter sp. GOD-10R]|uniref:relaxase/mobilization nuclease domain-containing protein n=1 Tax=Hymenobacter sp. GOD-10R TaxID=3093922 RepID=UPI002D7782A2|nr:relaxase/mobilization nuclease domain-containing protein [Hymenobacter sp. GOD-10R]WRQ31965.1 relaxase/mobilization nuclease domain-containing protein [Hymenobacter sp. GOD-10R]